MLIITLEGGFVSSVSSDDQELDAILNRGGIAIIDYDIDGADSEDLKTVRQNTQPGQPLVEYEALAHKIYAEATEVDTKALAQRLTLPSYEIVTVQDLCEDDRVDLQSCPYLCTHPAAKTGYAVVTSITKETLDCIRVSYEGIDEVGYEPGTKLLRRRRGI